MVDQLFPNKKQTRSDRRLRRGWIWSEGTVDVAGIGWMEVQHFCGPPFVPPLETKPCWPVGKDTCACGVVLLYFPQH